MTRTLLQALAAPMTTALLLVSACGSESDVEDPHVGESVQEDAVVLQCPDRLLPCEYTRTGECVGTYSDGTSCNRVERVVECLTVDQCMRIRGGKCTAPDDFGCGNRV